MRVTMIAAMDENRLMGTGEGGLPWSGLERDKKHFREYTAGKALLLGRRTFEEMLGWFSPEHRPVVVSRDEGYVAEGGYPVAGSVEKAIALAAGRGDEELVVCGGAQMYAASLEHATGLVLTMVQHGFEVGEAGGVYFPDWEGAGFKVVQREWFSEEAGSEFGMTFVWLER